MGELTPERLAELRRIAEAATPGPWRIPGANVFRVVAPETQNQGDPYYRWAVIADADPRSVDGEQAAANACYIAAFHPPTVLAMIGEIERLRRERVVLAAAVEARGRFAAHQESCYACRPIDPCTVGRDLEDAWLVAQEKALALLDGEKGGVVE